jgi:hypothetical protein
MTIFFNQSESKGRPAESGTQKRGSVFQSGGQTKQMPPRPRISTGRQSTKSQKSGK